jgi:epoxyqueuosine reductase QueG
MGADLVGIAAMDRLDGAPQGFHPRDVMPGCKSVVVFAKRFLRSTMDCNSTVPYTIVRNLLSSMMDEMAVRFCTEMEDMGIAAVPTGTIGPTLFDVRTGRFRNVVSAKHCAQAAGLGTIGKNTLLITPEFGNMVWLSVILTDAELEADEPLAQSLCPEKCTRCIDTCPIGALGQPEMRQTDCWKYAFGGENGGDFVIRCNRCRAVCPLRFGKR